MTLSTSEVRSFFDEGCLVLPNLFLTDEVEQIKAAFDRLVTLAQQIRKTQLLHGAQFVVEGDRIDRIVWCGAAEPILFTFAEDPRLIQPVSQLLGSSEFDHIICQAHLKIPGDEVAFPWHQDSQHRRYGTDLWNDLNGKGSFVQTILAVDEMAEDNGPLLYIPQSSKLGALNRDPFADISAHVDARFAKPILLTPGSVAFLHPFTIHGSFPNRSSRPRRIFINGYAFPDANRREYPGVGLGKRLKI